MLSIAAPTGIAAQEIRLNLIAEIFPPFSYVNEGFVTGFSIELVEQLFADTGISHGQEPEIYPWARAYYKASREPNIIVASMTRTEEREPLFRWVGPIAPREIWLYRLKSRPGLTISSLAEARRYRVGAMRGSACAAELAANGFKAGRNLELVTGEDQNLRKLLHGRVDLAGFNRAGLAWRLRQPSWKAAGKKVVPAFRLPSNYHYYLALSRQVSPTVVSNLQKSLDAMKRDGRYERIWRKHMEVKAAPLSPKRH